VPAQEPLDGRGQQRLGGLVPVPQVQDDPLEGPGGVDDEGVPGRLGRVEALDTEPPGAVEVGEEPPDGRQGEAQGAQRLVALLAGDLQGPLGGVILQTERVGGVGDQRDAGEQAGLEPGAVLGGPAESPAQEVDALGPLPVQVPQPGQRGRQAAAGLRVGRGQPPLQGGSEIRLLQLQPGAPGVQVPPQLGLDPLDEGQDMAQVAVPGGRDLAGVGQPVGGELPDRLQQPVAGLLTALGGHDQGLVDQPPQGVEHVVAADGPGGGHRTGRLQAEPAGEGG
jgi:hypothetical protein